jgi:hypothetical protein
VDAGRTGGAGQPQRLLVQWRQDRRWQLDGLLAIRPGIRLQGGHASAVRPNCRGGRRAVAGSLELWPGEPDGEVQDQGGGEDAPARARVHETHVSLDAGDGKPA